MKTVVILCVLVLALIGGAAAADKKPEPKKEEDCKKTCLDQKVKEPACKGACNLNKRFKNSLIGALQCSLKCNKKFGIGAPATKPCEDECKKKYEDKVAEITAGCKEVCTKEEKDPIAAEKCKKVCDPSLLYKEMHEKRAQAMDQKAAP